MVLVRFSQFNGATIDDTTRDAFLEPQIDFFQFFNGFGSFGGRFSNKKYTLQSTNFDGFGFVTRTSEITGKLKQSLPDSKKRVKSVEITTSFESGAEVSVKFDGITGLSLKEFTDTGFDSLRKVLKGNDEIRSTPGFNTLQGFRGNDRIFLETDNLALGGAGNDDFIFTPDVRNVQVLDYNPGKDTITVVGDTVDNYELLNVFGITQIQTLGGEVVLRLDNLNNPDLVRNLTLDDVFGLGGSGGDAGNVTV